MNILIVDDEEINREILGEILSETSHDLSFAKNGYEALSTITEKKIDLVFLDIEMPGISGLEVCEKIKSDENSKQIYVVMATAYSSEFDIAEGMKKGADLYLIKPFNREKIFEIIKNT